MVGQLRPVEVAVKGFEKEKENLSLLAAKRKVIMQALYCWGFNLLWRERVIMKIDSIWLEKNKVEGFEEVSWN